MLTNTLSSAVILLLVAAGPVCAQAPDADLMPDHGTTIIDPASTAIAMDLSNGRPMVALHVDGKGPYRFIVDTGAAYSVIDEHIASEIGLEVVGTQMLRSPGATDPVEGRRVQARALEAAGLRIEDPVLATMDLVAFSGGLLQGVLGMGHFSDLLLTFDYPASQLRIAHGSLENSDEHTVALGRTDGRLDIRFPIDVAGVAIPMVLDTGSPGGFTLPKAFEPRLSFRSKATPGPTIRLVGGTHETWVAEIDGVVTLGAISFENPEVVLYTITDDFGNIGMGVLRDLQVTLDQAKGLIRFVRLATDTETPGAARSVHRVGGPRVVNSGEKGRLGIAFLMSPAGFVKERGGLVVERVDTGGAADAAGLRAKDIVLSVNGIALADRNTVAEIGSLLRRERPLELDLLRDGASVRVVID